MLQAADKRTARQPRPRPKPQTVSEAFERLDNALQAGSAAELIPIPTGFEPLDRVLGGGLRPGELTLVGGIPGVGKTIATLQWARNIASQGRTTIFACYEHEEVDLLVRLLALEMGEISDTGNPEVERLRARIQEAANGTRQGLAKVLDTEALSRRAHERLERYSDRLWLLAASGTHTGLTQLEEAVAQRKGAPAVLFVDYLQKVAVRPEPPDEAEKVTIIAEGLKELALAYKIPIVCVVAADLEGLKARRLRLHHLRGSSALAFESDVVLVLNEKFGCIAKVHLAFDSVRAESFKDWVVFSIEKNRGGPSLMDLEFRKDFTHFRFDPLGGMVAEKLVDERLYIE